MIIGKIVGNVKYRWTLVGNIFDLQFVESEDLKPSNKGLTINLNLLVASERSYKTGTEISIFLSVSHSQNWTYLKSCLEMMKEFQKLLVSQWIGKALKWH